MGASPVICRCSKSLLKRHDDIVLPVASREFGELAS